MNSKDTQQPTLHALNQESVGMLAVANTVLVQITGNLTRRAHALLRHCRAEWDPRRNAPLHQLEGGASVRLRSQGCAAWSGGVGWTRRRRSRQDLITTNDQHPAPLLRQGGGDVSRC
jgi:hypothetical protein